MSAVRTCLVLRALGLGDLLTGVPALRALRRGLPDARVTLAAPASLAPLVALADVCDWLLPTSDLGPLSWEGSPPDLAVDLHGNGPASRDPLHATGAPRLLAFAGPEGVPASAGRPAWRRHEHERERWCRLLSEGLGIPADPGDLRLRRPAGAPAGPPGVVVIHPGAASGSRRWPAERFAAVAAHLARDAPVVVTGSAAETGLAASVAQAAGLPPWSVLAGSTGLGDLAGLVASARLVVSGDTGVAHLAASYGVPSVVLFGPTPVAWWGPPVDGPHVAIRHAGPDETGDPHGAAPDPRLLRIGVDEVVAAAEGLLGRASDGIL